MGDHKAHYAAALSKMAQGARRSLFLKIEDHSESSPISSQNHGQSVGEGGTGEKSRHGLGYDPLSPAIPP